MSAVLKAIPGLPRYSASDDGRVWSHITNRFMKPSLRRDGYLYLSLRHEGRYVQMGVHRLVCLAFHGVPAPGMEANHDDLNKVNNVPGNLEWMTPKANTEHAWKNLPPETIAWMRERRSFGAVKMNRQKRTLAPEQVQTIRALLAQGLSQQKTAARIGTSRNTVERIQRGATYVD